MNFSKCTTENNSANDLAIFWRWKREGKYIWFTRKYMVIWWFKLCVVFSIKQLRDPVVNGWLYTKT